MKKARREDRPGWDNRGWISPIEPPANGLAAASGAPQSAIYLHFFFCQLEPGEFNDRLIGKRIETKPFKQERDQSHRCFSAKAIKVHNGVLGVLSGHWTLPAL
jgi:hypothetical protein